MEVNKEQAELCRDLGAKALKEGNYPRAVKMLQKSLQLYPLPGVEALLSHAVGRMNEFQAHDSGAEPDTHNNGDAANSTSRAKPSAPTPGPPERSESNTGADGRAYTEEQVQIVQEVLRAKEGGRGAHYRVLRLAQTATESEIKKAYRKLSLKVHPDKNSAPHADEAFKAVGLAYATLSDPQKRTIYDRYGEEDPDNRGGGVRPGGAHMYGQEVSPEEIFNMFFGGGMAGMHRAGPGFHVRTAGFGPGVQFREFRTGGNRRQRREDEARQPEATSLSALFFQLLPILIIMLASFFRYDDDSSHRSSTMTGEGQYFSLTRKPPFVNPLKTKLTTVRDIPYYVTERFLHTYYGNRSQLSRVERMVELAYEQFLVDECTKQQTYKRRLQDSAVNEHTAEEKARKQKLAQDFELSRCIELNDLYPNRKSTKIF